MAVVDKYFNANLVAGKLANPAKTQGAITTGIVNVGEVAAADSDGSVYRIGTLPSNAIITNISINADVITGGNDYDVGLYDIGVSGAVIDKDVFADGLNLSGGAAIGSELNGLSAVAIDALDNKLYEHAGKTVSNKKEGYDLALTANTVGSAAGTITTRVEYILG
jgi:hypothetical protein